MFVETKREFKQMTIEEIDPALTMETINKGFEVSKETFDNLRYATDKACNDMAKAFEKLKREWEKAISYYESEIKKLRGEK